MLAAQNNHDQVARVLLENGAAADTPNKEGWTALMYSAQNGHDQCARAMIEAGANLDHQTAKRVTALNMACANGHEECAMLLLRSGSRSSDVADAWGDTPRSIAQKKGLQKVLALM